jgi:hypothetical protein
MAGLYQLWEHVLYSPSLEEFNEAWERPKAFFSTQTAILEYLEDTYMAIAPQWATCYTNKLPNFGQRSTSPVESVNRYLKSYIANGNSTVLEVVKQSFNIVADMEKQIEERRNDQKGRVRREFLGLDWVGDAVFHVSFKALSKARMQYRLALPSFKSKEKPNLPPLPPCTGRFTAQYGIPCSHEILRRHTTTISSSRRSTFIHSGGWGGPCLSVIPKINRAGLVRLPHL